MKKDKELKAKKLRNDSQDNPFWFDVTEGAGLSNMSVEVIEVRLLNNGKPLKAFADIRLDDLTVRDFRVIKQPKCRAYVAAPQISWRNGNGRINYKTIITMPDELRWKLESAILAEYQQRVKEQKSENKTN